VESHAYNGYPVLDPAAVSNPSTSENVINTKAHEAAFDEWAIKKP